MTKATEPAVSLTKATVCTVCLRRRSKAAGSKGEWARCAKRGRPSVKVEYRCGCVIRGGTASVRIHASGGRRSPVEIEHGSGCGCGCVMRGASVRIHAVGGGRSPVKVEYGSGRRCGSGSGSGRLRAGLHGAKRLRLKHTWEQRERALLMKKEEESWYPQKNVLLRLERINTLKVHNKSLSIGMERDGARPTREASTCPNPPCQKTNFKCDRHIGN